MASNQSSPSPGAPAARLLTFLLLAALVVVLLWRPSLRGPAAPGPEPAPNPKAVPQPVTPRGDLAIGDHATKSVNDYLDALEAHQAGDTVPLTILRDGRKEQVTVTLEGGQ